MTFAQASAIARKHIDKHLPGKNIQIEPSRTKRAIADATTNRLMPNFGILRISTHWLSHLTEEELVDVILHEIAHLMVGAHHGHNDVWKAACRRIGTKPERVKRTESAPAAKYKLWCPTCKKSCATLHRKNRAVYVCGKCRTKLVLRYNTPG